MLHIAMNLVNTALGREFKKITANLNGLVKPEYLHSSLVILKQNDFSPTEMQKINEIATNASKKIALLTNFSTHNYVTDNNGYLMLETKFEGLEAIIADMENAFEDAGFDIISKKPFHATIVKGAFGSEKEVALAMDNMKAVMTNESLKSSLCNKSFSIEGAVYAQAGYPKGHLAGTVQNLKTYHEFRGEQSTLDCTNDTPYAVTNSL